VHSAQDKLKALSYNILKARAISKLWCDENEKIIQKERRKRNKAEWFDNRNQTGNRGKGEGNRGAYSDREMGSERLRFSPPYR